MKQDVVQDVYHILRAFKELKIGEQRKWVKGRMQKTGKRKDVDRA